MSRSWVSLFGSRYLTLSFQSIPLDISFLEDRRTRALSLLSRRSTASCSCCLPVDKLGSCCMYLWGAALWVPPSLLYCQCSRRDLTGVSTKASRSSLGSFRHSGKPTCLAVDACK